MRIRSVTARGFKNLEVTGAPFRAVTLVHGPNGIGKSNLLQLVHVAFAKKEQLPEFESSEPYAFSIEGVYPDPDLLRRGASEGTVEVTLTCWSDAFRAVRTRFFSPVPQGENGSVKSKTRRLRVDGVPTTQDVTLAFSLTSTGAGVEYRLQAVVIDGKTIAGRGVELPTADHQKTLEDWIESEVANCTTYIPNGRTRNRLPVAYRVKHDFDAVQNLENALLRLNTSPRDFDALDSVKAIVQEFFGIQDIRSDLSVKPPKVWVEDEADSRHTPLELEQHLHVGVRLKEANGEWFDLDRVGTGIQQILVIITMLQTNRAKIALIEEFETSLSPEKRSRLMHELVTIVAQKTVLRQVIATSHAVYQPAQDQVFSIGYERTTSGMCNFREWAQSDWAGFNQSPQTSTPRSASRKKSSK